VIADEAGRNTEAAGGVTLKPILACGIFVLWMIGIALYGAKTLPRGARIKNFPGPAYAPKAFGLMVLPACGAILYGLFVGSVSATAHRSRHPVEIAILAFALLAFLQLWTITSTREDSESID
jgi:hypothetical protein